MKKTFILYSVIWAVLLVLLNVISFVSIGWTRIEKYTSSFWIGYMFITIAFIGQIICTYFALKEKYIKKTFYNIFLISTSYTGLVLSFVFGGLCMIISPIPYWVGIILCTIVLGLNVIAVVTIDIVGGIDKKVKESALFIKSLTVDAENLISRAKNESVKAECKKIYEAIRYSDPMSNSTLASIESEITIKFSDLLGAVVSDNLDMTIECANELIILISERNRKCKLLK